MALRVMGFVRRKQSLLHTVTWRNLTHLFIWQTYKPFASDEKEETWRPRAKKDRGKTHKSEITSFRTVIWTLATLHCLHIHHIALHPSTSAPNIACNSALLCPSRSQRQFDCLFFSVLLLYWLYVRNWPHTVLPVVLVGHCEGGVVRAVENHDSHTVHT